MFGNENIKRLKPYKLSSHKAWEKSGDEDVYKLDWNEATVPPSPRVFKALHDAIETGKLNWYPDTNNKRLIDLLAEYNQVSTDSVQYFASSDSLHEYIVRCFIGQTDRVLIIGPTYDNFRAVAESNGAQIQYYYVDGKFELDYHRFLRDIQLIKPKVVYLVNPNNPTGTLHSSRDLYEMIKSCPDSLFIIDEAYYEFSGQTLSGYIEDLKNLIITRTFSKAFALASFRLGYAISHTENIQLLNKIRNPKNVSMLAQVAGIAALEDIDYTREYVHQIQESKNLFLSQLKDLDWLQAYNSPGNFLFMKLQNPDEKAGLITHLESANIFIRDYGHLDSTLGFVRVTIGTKDQMKKVFQAFSEFKK